MPVPRMCSNWVAMLSKAHPTRQAKVCCAATVAKAIKLRASRYSTSPWPRTSPLSSREKRIFSAVGDAGLLFGPFRSSGAERSRYFDVQPKPSSIQKQFKFVVFSNPKFRCAHALERAFPRPTSKSEIRGSLKDANGILKLAKDQQIKLDP